MPDEKILKIGRFELVLPADHMLDTYKSKFKLYDWILGEVARLVTAKYPDATAIDIGANVGDSAAVLSRHRDMPILCIEGHPTFITFLRRNLARLPSGIEIADCLLGPASGTVPIEALVEAKGTASIDSANSSTSIGAQLRVQSLSDVLREHPRFERPRLIKVDTDGADFEIILSSMNVITDCRPILFFEYTLAERKTSIVESIEVISCLAGVGYNRFLVYDNFGNLLLVIREDAANKFMDMNRYVMSHLLFGRAIYYLDICAFSSDDQDLAEELYRYQCQLVDRNSRQQGWQF